MRSLKFDFEVRRRILILKCGYKISELVYFVYIKQFGRQNLKCYMDTLQKQTVSILIKYSTISFKIRKYICLHISVICVRVAVGTFCEWVASYAVIVLICQTNKP